MIERLFRFRGGVQPATHKDDSVVAPIAQAPLPKRLYVPLRPNTRAKARLIVEPGQKVLKGECIGEADGVLGTACHAPTSGTVVEIVRHAMPHPSDLPVACVVIEPDGEDRWIERQPFHCVCASSRQVVLDYLRDSGIVGLGGAAFPSHIKIGTQREVDTLILNGAECEPWITSDDRLMREQADEIMRGASLLAELTGAKRILIGIEDNKAEAIAAMREAATKVHPVSQVVAVPTLYPAGGEKQLIRVLTGIEIPHGKLGAEFGIRCFNVGTARAVHRAIDLGEPLISRVVTLTGNVEQPGNFEVLIGTPIEDLLPLVKPKAGTDKYLHGGPMMGFALPDLSAPVVKGTNCIIAGSPDLFPPPKPELPCIRCGACSQACPVDLQPLELYWFARAKNFGKAQEYHLFDCIECGCCAYVCPSHIPLVDYYRFAKSEIWAREREHNEADQARERFEFRNYRIEREKSEKAAKLAARAAETKAKLAAKAAAEGADADKAAEPDPKKALIEAAMKRAQEQKEKSAPKNTENLPDSVKSEIAEIDKRRKPLEAFDEPDNGASAGEENK